MGLGIVGSLIAAEIYAFLPSWIDRLLRFHASRLPEPLAERMLEEWRAVIRDTPGRVRALTVALDLFRAIPRLSNDYLAFTRGLRISRATLFVKRFVDLTIASVSLAMSAPCLVAIAILIKLDSEGPVFEQVERVGRYGRPFRLLKFRTYRHCDPSRLTRVGRGLRRMSLDFTPLFINVFRGEMSLVGPRALPPGAWLRESPSTIKCAVRPGLVGDLERPDLDSQYVHRLSIWSDLRILCSAIRIVVTGDFRPGK